MQGEASCGIDLGFAHCAALRDLFVRRLSGGEQGECCEETLEALAHPCPGDLWCGLNTDDIDIPSSTEITVFSAALQRWSICATWVTGTLTESRFIGLQWVAALLGALGRSRPAKAGCVSAMAATVRAAAVTVPLSSACEEAATSSQRSEQAVEPMEVTEHGPASTPAKFSWTPDLHHRFETAVHELGVDNATPKAIQKQMGCDIMGSDGKFGVSLRWAIGRHLKTIRADAEKAARASEALAPFNLAFAEPPVEALCYLPLFR